MESIWTYSHSEYPTTHTIQIRAQQSLRDTATKGTHGVFMSQPTSNLAVTGGTHDNKYRAYARWEEYFLSIWCRDIFMDSLSKQEHILLLGFFAMAVRKGRLSDSCWTHWLKAQSDKTQKTRLSSFYWDSSRHSEMKTLRRKATKGPSIICSPWWASETPGDRNWYQSRNSPKARTEMYETLVPQNVRFFMNCSRPHNPLIWNLRIVAITFKMQKHDLKHDTVIHGRTNNSILCPILQWARLVNRIWTRFIGYSGVHSLEKWSHGRHYLQKYPSTPAIGLQLIWKRSTPLGTSHSGYQWWKFILEKSPSTPSFLQVVERRFSSPDIVPQRISSEDPQHAQPS
jgi:hypothetical protein